MAHRALLLGVSGGGIDVALAERRLTPVLRGLGFTAIDSCSDERATRSGILRSLDRLIASCEAQDAVFVHYFGHGGRVRFDDLLPEQVFGYVSCTRRARAGFEAVLDRELTQRFTELDRRCANVTVMFDCCFSGELVRANTVANERREPAPEWARAVLSEDAGVELALDSHPRIVRICGASPKREAFAVVREGRHIGRLTQAFITALREAGDDWSRLCWATLGHRVREHVIAALEMESQWVVIAGPRTRRLFSRERVELPGSVAFVPADPGSGWLRAGWHQGVALGDRWGLIDARVDADAHTRSIGELEVVELGRNRSRVELRGQPSATLHAGTPAVLLALREPIAVELDDPQLLDAIVRSPWLSRANSDTPAPLAVTREAEAWRIDSRDGARARARVASPAAALELLEDRARVQVLQRSLAEHEPSECPLQWRWSLADQPERPLPESGARLRAGERVRVDVEFPSGGPPQGWFVCVVLVDPAGRLRLLSARLAEGVELGPGEHEIVGIRGGRRGAQGIELRWPEAVSADEAPASLLILASRRPIELAHLVRPQPEDDDDALALQGLDADTTREHRPEHTRGCAWVCFDFVLRR